MGNGLKKGDCDNTGPQGAIKGFNINFSSSKFHKKEIAEFSPFLSRHKSRAPAVQSDKDTRSSTKKMKFILVICLLFALVAPRLAESNDLAILVEDVDQVSLNLIMMQRHKMKETDHCSCTMN